MVEAEPPGGGVSCLDNCNICNVSVDAPDPVEPSKKIKSAPPRKKTWTDWYCRRVHELRHKDKDMKQLIAWVQADPEHMKNFMAMRSKCIEILKEGGDAARLRASSLPAVYVAHVSSKADRDIRRGKKLTAEMATEESWQRATCICNRY